MYVHFRTFFHEEWPSVGFIRQSDKHIHLGRGIYMPLLCYDAAKVNAKSKFSIFFRNIAVFVFTPQVLISSSVEGIKCNRTKTSHPALDSTKLSAIHDISRFYLKELGTNEVTIELLVDKIGRIINSKISDMRRLPGSLRSKSTKRSTDELSKNSHPDVIVEETIEENFNGYNTTIRQRLDSDTDSEEAEEAVVIGDKVEERFKM
ncbi:uncharacterized protein LOC117176713 [Belonocnema kinseyi]|uniref:uncharacterized protein LOC117176713 n=1 Tax=Belonocnema kinseyi TaxID=2817044 RepID=UPI00143D6495|nr:uncharacterized protein LOC117176713 [Belonocnema kinseyi]